MFSSKLPPENKQNATPEEIYVDESESLSVGMDVYVEDVNGSKVFHLAKITSINIDANTASCFVYDQVTNVVRDLDSIFLVGFSE